MRFQIALFIVVLGIYGPIGSLIIGGRSEFTHYGSRTDVFQHFDSYGEIPFSEEKLHLDNFGEVIMSDPNAKNFVVLYEGKGGDKKTVKYRACRALRYLIEEKNINPALLAAVSIYGKHSNELHTDLWRTPIEYDGVGPNDYPNVPANEIESIKGTEVWSKCPAVPAK